MCDLKIDGHGHKPVAVVKYIDNVCIFVYCKSKLSYTVRVNFLKL